MHGPNERKNHSLLHIHMYSKFNGQTSTSSYTLEYSNRRAQMTANHYVFFAEWTCKYVLWITEKGDRERDTVWLTNSKNKGTARKQDEVQKNQQKWSLIWIVPYPGNSGNNQMRRNSEKSHCLRLLIVSLVLSFVCFFISTFIRVWCWYFGISFISHCFLIQILNCQCHKVDCFLQPV